jgi:hypothetical protein
MAALMDPKSEPAKPFADVARAAPAVEAELLQAVQEIERGDYLELSPEALDLWAEAGVVPWPENP